MCKAFVPACLPPAPPLDLEEQDRELIGQANRALGRLDGMSRTLPQTAMFIYQYIRKEALLSSQIEGTQSSFSELLFFESAGAPGAPGDGAAEVSNYVRAMNHSIDRLKEGLPVCNRLIKEAHEILLSSGRGSEKRPGEFRIRQNWIDGSTPEEATYVPPPPELVEECMADLERFIHGEPTTTETLVKAALAHAQFESIHPFLDGNGRLGRLLVTLILMTEGVMSEPLLYLSLFLKKHRTTYYDHLQHIRTTGDWESWIRFFMRGVTETADQAVETAGSILDLFEKDRRTIDQFGRSRGTVLRVHDFLQKTPLATIAETAKGSNLSIPATSNAMRKLEAAGIIEETTGKKRGRLYYYKKYISILARGTELSED